MDQLLNLCKQYFRSLDILCYIEHLIELDINIISACVHKRPKTRLPYLQNCSFTLKIWHYMGKGINICYKINVILNWMLLDILYTPQTIYFIGCAGTSRLRMRIN